MRNCFRFFLFCLLFIVSSCAIQVAPTGGEKDETAPTVKISTPENYSTRFSGRDIRISFDEFIALKELGNQFVVSPPLKYQPDIKVKKKTLEIHIEDTLLRNTTYTMNFGSAITDIREGNAVEEFQYVFATGDVIDSLKISGKVENSYDKKTEKGIFVMLYRGTDDSIPLKTLPDYFAKTTADGSFEVKNVSPGNYRIFALKDNNSNYLFDNNDEVIAFDPEPVEAGKSKRTLSLFKETRKQQLLKSGSDEPGRATIIYTLPIRNEKIIFLSDTSAMKIHSMSFSGKKDTLTFWYRNIQSDSLNFILQHELGIDTITIRLKQFDPKAKSKSLPTLSTQFNSKSEPSLELNKPLQLIFNHPVDSFHFSNITVTEDSLPVPNPKIFFSDSLKKNLIIDFPKKDKTKYTVFVPASAFKDIFGWRNDTLKLNFLTRSVADYGTMAIVLKASAAKNNFILQLIDEKETIYRQSIIHSDTTINYDFLDPKSYRLKIIEDLNNNNEWDTGNYLQHKQPERVFYYKESLTVRANWDVDVKWGMGAEGN